MRVVAKFGGSSLADAGSINNVLKIIQADPMKYSIVVVSAPGKRCASDTRVTDLLLALFVSKVSERKNLVARIRERFIDILSGFELLEEFRSDLDEMLTSISPSGVSEPSRDFVLSRGEYFMARILARVLGWAFVDATNIVAFDSLSKYDAARTKTAFAALETQHHIVVPGFYGACGEEVMTFSRGGSDVTGAILAQLSHVDVYENWTDVSGVQFADPGIIPYSRPIREMTYQELRELSYRGAKVLHEEALFPVREADIPVNIRNTYLPDDPGTWIRGSRSGLNEEPVVGIASRIGFLSFELKKPGMNRELGFLSRMCGVFLDHKVNIEHLPSGIDTQSIVVDGNVLDENHIKDLQLQLERVCALEGPPTVSSLAIICVVGETMSHKHGIAARLFAALHEARISVRIIDQGSSEINIVVGVDETDHEHAVRAIYDEFA